MFREDHPAARLTDGMTRTTDTLKSPSDGPRALDEQHEFDARHVDAQFQGTRCNDRTQLSLRE